MTKPMSDKGGFGGCGVWHATHNQQEDCIYCEVRQLREDLLSERAAGDVHSHLNRRTAQALGKPISGKNSSWHDIPEQVRELKETIKGHEVEIQRLRAFKKEVTETLDVYCQKAAWRDETIEGHEATMREVISMAHNWPECYCDSEDKCSICLIESILKAQLKKYSEKYS